MQGKCKLCLKEAKLQYSHIIPEFLYSTTYDDLHRAIKVTPNTIESPPYIQKGMRQHLLCSDCETQLSKYESYTSILLASVLASEPAPGEQFILMDDVKYAPFKLFQISLLWRSSVASLTGFDSFSLGSYEEDLRIKIRKEDPGKPLEYACLLMMWPRGGHVERVVITPIREEFAGKIYYRFHTGPWFWYFLHPGQFEANGETDLVVSKSGVLRVSIAQWREEDFMKNLRALVLKTRHERSRDQGA